MRILHIIPQLASGGAERVVLALARQQRRMGLDARLIVLGSENAFPHRLTDLPEPWFLGYGGRRRDIAGFIGCVMRLRRQIAGQGADVVHSHLWPASRAAAWAVRGLRGVGAGVPHLVHVHDTRPWLAAADRRSRLLRAWTRWSLRGTEPAGGFIAVSDAVRRYMSKHLPGLATTLHVCYNGIDIEPFATAGERGCGDFIRWFESPGGNRPIVIGTAGRFAEEKGHVQLIRAVAALRQGGVDIRLRIAGDGHLRPQYEKLIVTAGLTDAVELPGKVADMPAFYRQLDLFALPSLGAEGLPITLLEAMASGLPIVASDVAGVDEAIHDGVHGTIVAPGDEAALARAIAAMLANPSQACRRALAAGQRAAEHFSVQIMTCRCVERYEQVARLRVSNPRRVAIQADGRT